MYSILTKNNHDFIKKEEDRQNKIYKRRLLGYLDKFYKDKYTHYSNKRNMLTCWRENSKGKEFNKSGMYYPPSLDEWLIKQIRDMENHKITNDMFEEVFVY